MTKDEVNKLMKEAGPLVKMPFDQWCERFAALVAAAEQERCCRIVFGMCISDNNAQEIVSGIRAGGTT